MRRPLLLLSVVLVALCAVPAAYAQGEIRHAPDQVVVKFRDGVPPTAKQGVAALYGLQPIEVGYREAFHVFRTPANASLNDVIAALSRSPEVERVEANGIARTCVGEPNDLFYVHPYPGFQWNFYDQGTECFFLGTSDYGIEAPSGWALFPDEIPPGSGVKVAIVDTGVAYDAPDLAGTSFDLANDYDFVNDDDDAYDDNGHGTHVCGTVAETTNNEEGCAGIAYGATILPIKVIHAEGWGYYSWIANGIMWAADHGAKVINLSLGGYVPSEILQDAVDYAWSKGCVLAAAAGNDSEPTCLYPAAYENCIAVGATNFYGYRAWYSNYGEEIDVLAPGGDFYAPNVLGGILQQSFTIENGSYFFDYFFGEGTSMATAHVTGVAALVWSHPDNLELTPSEVRFRIERCGKPPAGWPWAPMMLAQASPEELLIVNAYGAVKGPNPLGLAKSDSPDPVSPGGTLTYTISYDNLANTVPVNNVVIVDTLPPEVSYVSSTGGGVYNPVTHTVTWTIGSLAAGDPGGSVSATVLVGAGAIPGSTIVNYATIDSDETPPTTVTEPTTIAAVANRPPDTSGAYADPGELQVWRFNNALLQPIEIQGVTDPDGDPVTIVVESIFQDEPVKAPGDYTAPDGIIVPQMAAASVGDGIWPTSAMVRAERNSRRNGRFYHIFFTAYDTAGNSSPGHVTVQVPLRPGVPPIDEGPLYDSTQVP